MSPSQAISAPAISSRGNPISARLLNLRQAAATVSGSSGWPSARAMVSAKATSSLANPMAVYLSRVASNGSACHCCGGLTVVRAGAKGGAQGRVGEVRFDSEGCGGWWVYRRVVQGCGPQGLGQVGHGRGRGGGAQAVLVGGSQHHSPLTCHRRCCSLRCLPLPGHQPAACGPLENPQASCLPAGCRQLGAAVRAPAGEHSTRGERPPAGGEQLAAADVALKPCCPTGTSQRATALPRRAAPYWRCYAVSRRNVHLKRRHGRRRHPAIVIRALLPAAARCCPLLPPSPRHNSHGWVHVCVDRVGSVITSICFQESDAAGGGDLQRRSNNRRKARAVTGGTAFASRMTAGPNSPLQGGCQQG